ncbi:hypothetical protein B0A49_11262, partial [Cryomyces minteri]
SLGSHVKDISSITATAFGFPHKVAAGTGSRSWREAYRSMLEGVLRDAEDALSHFLDEIKEPSLVILDLASERNVLVDEQTKQISGMLGCANAVWGDPLMANVFDGPSEAFLEGFGPRPSRVAGAEVRQLLYVMYRATVTIVTHYYRPAQECREFEARRLLTSALNQLTGI